MSSSDGGVVDDVVRVGVGVLIRDPLHPHKIFAGLRKNSHGAGTLALPGGHLEMYESWEECAIRETKEETGLLLDNVQFGHVTNDIMIQEKKHYITIFMLAQVVVVAVGMETNEDDDNTTTRRKVSNNNRPINLEPHKCDGWNSYSWEELRQFASFSQHYYNNNNIYPTSLSNVEEQHLSHCKDDNDKDDKNGNNNAMGKRPVLLFGLLLKLVEEAPPKVVNFINNIPSTIG